MKDAVQAFSEKVLSALFPPDPRVLPIVETVIEKVSGEIPDVIESGIVAKHVKPYRDAIERHFTEEN